jgi:hypothetical protein
MVSGTHRREHASARVDGLHRSLVRRCTGRY